MALSALLMLLLKEGKCDFLCESMINEFLDTLPGTMLLSFEVANKTFRMQWVCLKCWGPEGEDAKGQKKLEKKPKILRRASSRNFILGIDIINLHLRSFPSPLFLRPFKH